MEHNLGNFASMHPVCIACTGRNIPFSQSFKELQSKDITPIIKKLDNGYNYTPLPINKCSPSINRLFHPK